MLQKLAYVINENAATENFVPSFELSKDKLSRRFDDIKGRE
jgi:hypothetical protein